MRNTAPGKFFRNHAPKLHPDSLEWHTTIGGKISTNLNKQNVKEI